MSVRLPERTLEVLDLGHRRVPCRTERGMLGRAPPRAEEVEFEVHSLKTGPMHLGPLRNGSRIRDDDRSVEVTDVSVDRPSVIAQQAIRHGPVGLPVR